MPDGAAATQARKGALGRPMRRREDAALLRGEACFAADAPRPPGCLHAAFRRADQAPGRVTAVDAAAARAMPGVVAVLCAADLGPLGQPALNRFLPGMPAPRFAALAAQVAAVDQPVALVLADTAAAAQDGAGALEIGFEAATAATDEPAFGARWDAGEAEAAFAAAARVVRARVRWSRLAPAPLEPRAALAVPEDGGLTLWLSTQTPHRARADLAAILGLEEARLRVIARQVGGAFGGKASLYPEEAAVALAARRLGRAVLWQGTRAEEMLAATQGRGAVLDGEMALDADGRATALRAALRYPLGHRLPYSAAVPGRNAARILPGGYRIPALRVGLEAHFDGAAAMGIHRGAGRPEAAMLLERLMDRAAAATGLDPAAIRLRNLLPPEALPFATPTGEVLDSGDYPALLQRALALAGGDWPALAAARGARRARGEVVGLGLGFYVEPCGQGWESARITLLPDGRLRAATGSTAQGQGRETAFAQIVAEALRVEPEAVAVLHGDTAATPPGIGALASRSTGIGGGALLRAAAALEALARPRAAELLQVAEDALRPAPGGFAAGGATLPWRALAPLEAEAVFHAEGESWAAGCVLARVAIDRDTGTPRVEHLAWADDIGTVVNPMLVEGQMRGGLMQGLGEALLERMLYDAEGQLLTGSFMDYAMPRATDLPEAVRLGGLPRNHPARNTPLGAKGVGEAGCIGVPAAIVNAVLDALVPFGAAGEDVSLPLTPESIWRALQGGCP
jgi:carbon-monoxide dehydrogenase large subunit